MIYGYEIFLRWQNTDSETFTRPALTQGKIEPDLSLDFLSYVPPAYTLLHLWMKILFVGIFFSLESGKLFLDLFTLSSPLVVLWRHSLKILKSNLINLMV